MIRVGLICNSRAAFPLMQWIQEQGCLSGVGILAQQSEFSEDIKVLSQQLSIGIQSFERQNITQQLVDWQSIIIADVILVLGFPFRIRKRALDSVRLGYFNIHFGKLPEFGGSFPVFWQIVKGEKQGCLTIHKMDESFDRGPVAVEVPFEILQGQTFGMVEANYGYVAVSGAFQLLGSIMNQSLALRDQRQNGTDFFPKPTLKDLLINWQHMTSEEIVRLVKATNPWNRGALARVNGLDIKVIEASVGEGGPGLPGEILSASSEGWEVSCKNDTSLLIRLIYCSFGYLDHDHMGALGVKNGDLFDRFFS